MLLSQHETSLIWFNPIWKKECMKLLSFVGRHSAPVGKVANLIFYEIRLYFFNENESGKQLVLHWLSGCATTTVRHTLSSQIKRWEFPKEKVRIASFYKMRILNQENCIFFILKPKTTAFCNLSCATSQLTYRFHHNPTCIPANFYYCKIEYQKIS